MYTPAFISLTGDAILMNEHIAYVTLQWYRSIWIMRVHKSTGLALTTSQTCVWMLIISETGTTSQFSSEQCSKLNNMPDNHV